MSKKKLKTEEFRNWCEGMPLPKEKEELAYRKLAVLKQANQMEWPKIRALTEVLSLGRQAVEIQQGKIDMYETMLDLIRTSGHGYGLECPCENCAGVREGLEATDPNTEVTEAGLLVPKDTVKKL